MSYYKALPLSREAVISYVLIAQCYEYSITKPPPRAEAGVLLYCDHKGQDIQAVGVFVGHLVHDLFHHEDA